MTEQRAATLQQLSSTEELDGLPFGSIVRGGNGHAYEKQLQWTMVGRRWLEAGNSSPERSDDIPLPALLLFHPGWEPSGLDEFHPDTSMWRSGDDGQ